MNAHPEEDRDEHQAGAQIRLAVDERPRRDEQHERTKQDERRADPVVPVREPFRQDDDHEDLRELAHLELLSGDRHPSLSAEDVVPDGEHEDEEPDREEVEERRERAEPGVVEVRDRGHEPEAECREDDRPRHHPERIGRGPVLDRGRVGDDDAVGHQEERREQEVGIDLLEPPERRPVVQWRRRARHRHRADAHGGLTLLSPVPAPRT